MKDFSLPFLPSDLVCGSTSDLTSKEEVVKAIKTSLASMQYGNEDFLADLVADACSKRDICFLCIILIVVLTPHSSILSSISVAFQSQELQCGQCQSVQDIGE